MVTGEAADSLPTVAPDSSYFTDAPGMVRKLRKRSSTGLTGMDFRRNYSGSGAIDDYGHSRISATGSSGVINTKAKAGKTYDYKVVAVNKTGAANSADSGVVSVKSK